jgi:hypothetical protein
MSDNDLIRRSDADAAIVKCGGNGATRQFCRDAITTLPAADPLTDPRVQALVEALRDIRDTGGRFGTVSHMAKVDRIARAALAAFKGDEA